MNGPNTPSGYANVPNTPSLPPVHLPGGVIDDDQLDVPVPVSKDDISMHALEDGIQQEAMKNTNLL